MQTISNIYEKRNRENTKENLITSFLNKIQSKDCEISKERILDLILENTNKKSNLYQIEVSIEQPFEKLYEHETYKTFQKTNNRYVFHNANPSIPVKAHYHIYPSNGKKELYAVNMDGSAHHGKNKGHLVPKKEAEELRTLGVRINDNNLLESEQSFDSSNILKIYITFENDLPSQKSS